MIIALGWHLEGVMEKKSGEKRNKINCILLWAFTYLFFATIVNTDNVPM